MHVLTLNMLALPFKHHLNRQGLRHIQYNQKAISGCFWTKFHIYHLQMIHKICACVMSFQTKLGFPTVKHFPRFYYCYPL